MSTSAESARSKKELLKFDRHEVFKLLKSKGSLEAVSGFLDDVEFLLRVDAESFAVKAPDAFLHEELEKILENSDVLLKSLQKYRFDQHLNIAQHNLQIVNLIADSLLKLRQEKGSLITTKEKSLVDCHIQDGIPFNYPGPLIDSLHEFIDAVNHAMKVVYVPSGTSPNGNPEYIRKRVLANLFVRDYYRRFNRYPPVTKNGSAIEVFDRLIFATGMSEKGNLHYIRNAIDACKGMSLHISDDVNLSNT